MTASGPDFKPPFPAIDWWQRIVLKPGDLAQYKRPDFYEYYRTKFEIACECRPRRIAEIGVRWGYSAYSFLSANPSASYTGFDIIAGPHGGAKCCDTFGYVRNLLALHFPDARLDLHHSDTRLLTELPGGPFDFLHIDGDHSEAGCTHDLSLAMDACTPGGTILVDDYNYIAGVTRAADRFCTERCEQIGEKFTRHSLRGELIIRKAQP